MLIEAGTPNVIGRPGGENPKGKRDLT
jgi:hypothetical protein